MSRQSEHGIAMILHYGRVYSPYVVLRSVVAYDAPVVQKLGA